MKTKTIVHAKYGTVEFELLEFKPVSKIFSKDIPTDCMFSWDVAEQIALITDNRGVQMSCSNFGSPSDDTLWFAIVQLEPSSAWISRVKRLIYTGPVSAQKEIEEIYDRERQYYCHY